jgi:hypothetical protein
MTDRRIVGMWAGEDWNLQSYAWRGPCVKSPMSGQNLRAIVAMDDRGKFHPGLRNSEWRGGPEYKTVYQDFTSYSDKNKAIQEAKTMLSDMVQAHEDTHNYLAGQDQEIERTKTRVNSILERASRPKETNQKPAPNRARGRSIDR